LIEVPDDCVRKCVSKLAPQRADCRNLAILEDDPESVGALAELGGHLRYVLG